MLPFNLSASNACVGWPSSSITKLETSTMLLIDRMPTLSIFARNHCGLGPTFTLSILRAEKNGHSPMALLDKPVLLMSMFASRGVELTFGAAAVIHLANRQPIGIGMTRRRGDL